MADVFINYARVDRHQAEKLARALEAFGYSVWSDTALLAGVDFRREIERNIRESKCMVTLWSEKSVASNWVIGEAGIGQQLSILINAKIDSSKIPMPFAALQHFDIGMWQTGLDHPAIVSLLEMIGKFVGRLPRQQQAADVSSWAVAQAANTVLAFEQFITSFPDSLFASEARRRISLIRNSNRSADGKVFLSYRRDDSQAVARLIFERLGERIGRDKVFFDVDAIAAGVDFRDRIFGQLVQCSTLFAIIGRDWLGRTIGNQSRVMDATDFVRQEIELAFASGLRIIPVLAGSAIMPKPDELPEKMKRLPFIQAAQLDLGRDYETHIVRLIAAVTGEKLA